jgi:hypothetical protein
MNRKLKIETNMIHKELTAKLNFKSLLVIHYYNHISIVIELIHSAQAL